MQLDRPADAPPRRRTLAEWADLREDEPGELRDGLLVEEEMPDGLHEVTVACSLWGELDRLQDDPPT